MRQMATYHITFDSAGLDKIFTADFIEISPAGEFDPHDKVLGFYTAEKKPGSSTIPAIDVSEFSIRNYGEVAIVIAKLTYTVSPTIPSRSIRATFVCRREKNAWKIASSQYTAVRPPRPPKT
ncbi:MAG: nuclear transport factor 2 family protein [Pyrinomonadaceae bacterium]